MERTIHEAQLILVNIIRDVLVDLAMDSDVTPQEIEEMNDHFGRVAEYIIDQIGLEICDAQEDGKVLASVNPARGWM